MKLKIFFIGLCISTELLCIKTTPKNENNTLQCGMKQLLACLFPKGKNPTKKNPDACQKCWQYKRTKNFYIEDILQKKTFHFKHNKEIYGLEYQGSNLNSFEPNINLFKLIKISK